MKSEFIIIAICFVTNALCIMTGTSKENGNSVINEDQENNPLRIETYNTSLRRNDDSRYHFIIKNEGEQDEYIKLKVKDENGNLKENQPSEFPLPIQSTKDVYVKMDYPMNHSIGAEENKLITIEAQGIKNSLTVKRSIYYPGSDLEYGGRNQPFCYDRYVTGNCRYRTDPEYCFQYEWTAYAIVQNIGSTHTIQSIPEGLFVEPGNQERVRVWVKTSCCTPYVKLISSGGFFESGNICIVDVRELQGLHPAEIAGIVVGVVLFVIILIVIVALLIRKRRANSGRGTFDDTQTTQVKTRAYATSTSASRH